MLDLLYIAGTVAFFALMLLYVRFCVSLAGRNEAEETRHDA
ncbi:MAG: hypothetical protein ACHQQR_03570 [Gemmatimonadales bacterium]